MKKNFHIMQNFFVFIEKQRVRKKYYVDYKWVKNGIKPSPLSLYKYIIFFPEKTNSYLTFLYTNSRWYAGRTFNLPSKAITPFSSLSL